MTVEDDLYATLKTLVSGHVYRDVKPQNVTVARWITFQHVGGESLIYLDGSTPDLRQPRTQINVWAYDRDEVTALALTLFQASPLGEPISVREDDTEPKLYGTIQDFRVAHT